MTTSQPAVPNHHACYPGFAGPAGFLAAATMVLGRQDNARLAERLSELAAGDSVADIGCGPGAAARRAARLGASVTGIDPAPVMLRVARCLTPRSLHAVRYAQGSAEALPLPDSSVSVAWSIACVHHWADLDAGLREVRRVLRPGGRLLAIERLTKPGARGLASHGWTDEQASAFADRCRAHGFADITTSRHDGSRRTTASVSAVVPQLPARSPKPPISAGANGHRSRSAGIKPASSVITRTTHLSRPPMLATLFGLSHGGPPLTGGSSAHVTTRT
ncbi:MAG: class I SAM-dependent methyltransferase [Trebonia sp.]